ncbi:MAG: LUD domain-containing protein [Ruminococcaceae bacterium]|nr:LUD domain-containing protein [Oscillospiraceae bacterium]
MADIAKLEKNLKSRGFEYLYFEEASKAAEYLINELSGKSVGIGGSRTVEALGIYEALQGESDLAWHWKQEPNEARAKAAIAEVYICSANGIAETGEIVNIDGNGNRLASTLYGHKEVIIVSGVNKIMPDLESAIFRARNVAAPLNARRFNLDTPCVTGELKCYDCRSEKRICRGMTIQMQPCSGQRVRVIIIGEELGY